MRHGPELVDRLERCVDGTFDQLDEFLDVEWLRESCDEVGILKVLGLFVEAGDDDEFRLDVLPSGKEFEDHFSGEARHLEIQEDDVELMVRVREHGYCIVSVTENGNVVLFSEYGKKEKADSWIVVDY